MLARQRVVDTILRTFGRCAASQDCVNSFGWEMGGRDLAMGEVVPGWHGKSAANVHSTNTRNTNPEVIEKRTAVLVRRYAVRGHGRFRGGDGTGREIEVRVPLKFSILSDRRLYTLYGMNGGHAGKRGENYVFKFSADEGEEEGKNDDTTDHGHESFTYQQQVNGGDGRRKKTKLIRRITLGGKAVVNLAAGEIMQINTPGGGGWCRPNGDESDEAAACGDDGP